MKQYSRTARHFVGRKFSDGVVGPRTDRLSWAMPPKAPATPDRLAASIRDMLALGTVFFADNSVFDDGMPDEVWAALLSVRGGLALTPGVLAELAPWLRRRPGHRIAVAVRDDDPAIRFVEAPAVGAFGRLAYEYYVALLAARRRALVLPIDRFTKVHGRPPAAEDLRALRAELQQGLGERGLLLATKPSPHRVDEQLVYLAVESAIRTGRRSVVLTRDEDIGEQFYKLLWLLDMQYRAMLLADRYADQFGDFRLRPMPGAYTHGPEALFAPEQAILIDYDVQGDPAFRGVLPPDHEAVNVACWTVAGHYSTLSFIAERGMMRLLRAKDRTAGLNTERLGRRNLHIWLPPPTTGAATAAVAVAIDERRRLPGGAAYVAKLDIAHALTNNERSASVA